MLVHKRDGRTVPFESEKISQAVLKAFNEVDGEITPDARRKASEIATSIAGLDKDLDVEEIQDLVEDKLMASKRKDVSRKYIRYRYKKELARTSKNTTDETILEMLGGTSEYWNGENSNKDAKVATVQRDYLAGITSTDLTRRVLLPENIVKAHDEGIIHFHDADYFAQTISNCSLINLDDMLQNGTVINKVMIEKPHRFITACTIATQIITAVASSQYGGCTVGLYALAPFVRSSYEIYLKKYLDRGLTEEQSKKFADEDTRKEVADGVQTFNYQVNSMSTTNGQAPFLSVCMYLGETEEYKKELAMIIEEFLNQRIVGMKNSEGVYVTQAFPKLLYVLEEDNIHEDSEYWYLTKLAAKCTAKRMVPDYISEKVMKEMKINENGERDAYPCMGCVDGQEVVIYKFEDKLYVESFERMWDRLSKTYPIAYQLNQKDLFIDTNGVEIWDNKENRFVKNYRVIRNTSNNWMEVIFSNGRCIKCTTDHPFETSRGVVFAKDLKEDDQILLDKESMFRSEISSIDLDEAWLYGFMLCDGCYSSGVSASIALRGEDEIQDSFMKTYKNLGYEVSVIEQHRGEKGDYKDLIVHSNGIHKMKELKSFYTSYYEGINKNSRHIPNEVFSWTYDAKCAFMAGMIDADGYINNQKVPKVQIGSVNKELAFQQMLLAQTLGLRGSIYQNHYNTKHPEKIRYRVEFIPNEKLVSFVRCEKKRKHATEWQRKNDSINMHDYATPTAKLYLPNEERYSYDVTTESEHFCVSGIYSHNCRSFLTPDSTMHLGNIAKAKNFIPNKGKYYGRFNMGVVTINLPDVALSANKDMDLFWKIFDERLELCHEALRCRYKRLKGVSSDVAPILWQDGAFARLDVHEPIDELLIHGYATISLGYAGLYECVKAMTGKSHSDEAEGEAFGLAIMQHMNDKCAEWREAEDIAYSPYGSPIESTTYKFAKCLKKRFGDDVFVKLDGRDRNYITNSYHCAVFEEINPFEKLRIESKFQKLSPGGAISYTESSDLTHNISAVLKVIQYIYDNIMYAELNTKSDYCHVCGYDGEIKIIDENGELIWECPNCGNRDQRKMNVARRTCGYVGTNFWNKGRTDEIHNRYVHLTDIEAKGV